MLVDGQSFDESREQETIDLCDNVLQDLERLEMSMKEIRLTASTERLQEAQISMMRTRYKELKSHAMKNLRR